ncbi:hypothetical protein EXS73_02905 [Candidatus Pacearchaeota archaeon]|nr:hypothetical protein [Candidatus Pacearchaeota archaeon]
MKRMPSTQALARELNTTPPGEIYHLMGRVSVNSLMQTTAPSIYWADGALMLTADTSHRWTVTYQNHLPETGLYFETNGHFECATQKGKGEHIRVELGGSLEGQVLTFTPKGDCFV